MGLKMVSQRIGAVAKVLGFCHCSSSTNRSEELPILAFQSPQVQKEIIAKTNFIKFTNNTIVDPETFAAELELTRQRGYAVDDMEHEVGVCCIAAPIWDAFGKAVASLSVLGPSIRITKAKMPEFAQLIMTTTREISKELGAKNY
jgi:DNA-binding IclR family transcriptional regulator